MLHPNFKNVGKKWGLSCAKLRKIAICLIWFQVYYLKEVIDQNTDPVNKLLLAGTVLVNKLLLTGTLSNVRRCWLAMPLV